MTNFVSFLDRQYGDISSLGTPVTSAIISDNIDGETRAWVPLVNDPTTEEIAYILLYNENVTGDYTYHIFERPSAQIDEPALSGALGGLSESSNSNSSKITEDDVAYLFSRYEEALYGKELPIKYQEESGEECESRGWWPFTRRPRCYDFGGSFFGSIANWIKDAGDTIRGWFSSGSGEQTTPGGDPDDFTGTIYIFVSGSGVWTGNDGGSVRPNPGDVAGGTAFATYHHVDMLMLQDCEGYLEPHDTEETPNGVHPNFDFCSQWIPYREDCLDGFESYEVMLEQMALLYHYERSVFDQVIKHDDNCNAAPLIELIFSKDGVSSYNFSSDGILRLLENPELIEALMELGERGYGFGTIPSLQIEEIIPLLVDLDFLSIELIDRIALFYDRHENVYANETAELVRLGNEEEIEAILAVDEEYGLNEDELSLLIENPELADAYSHIYSLVQQLDLGEDDMQYLLVNYSENSSNSAYQLVNDLLSEDNSPEAKMASKVTILAGKTDQLSNLGSNENYAIWEMFDYCLPNGEVYTPWLDTDPDPTLLTHHEKVLDEMLFLKLSHPDWSDLKLRLDAEYNVISGNLHTLLDVCGLVEAFGTPCDLANGLFYAIEGNGADATLSLLGALPGGFIVTSGRTLKKIVKIGNSTRRFAWRMVDGLVSFSHGSSYRTVWKGVYPQLNNIDNIAHHVIPQAFWDNPLVQKAAKANPENLPSGVDPFHMNTPSNGFPVHTSRHTENHPNYSSQITEKMNDWALNPNHANATPEQVATALSQWQVLLKDAIGNTSSNINNINLPDIPSL